MISLLGQEALRALEQIRQEEIRQEEIRQLLLHLLLHPPLLLLLKLLHLEALLPPGDSS